MTKLIKWMSQKKIDEDETKEGTLESSQKVRGVTFRALMSKDSGYIDSKQKVMQPVFDLSLKKTLNQKAKINWLKSMIQKDSLHTHYQDWMKEDYHELTDYEKMRE